MPDEDKNILKYNHEEKSLKAVNTTYVDLESLLIKPQSSQNDPEKSYIEKKAIHEVCGYSINVVRSYRPNKNIRSFHRGVECIKKIL